VDPDTLSNAVVRCYQLGRRLYRLAGRDPAFWRGLARNDAAAAYREWVQIPLAQLHADLEALGALARPAGLVAGLDPDLQAALEVFARHPGTSPASLGKNQATSAHQVALDFARDVHSHTHTADLASQQLPFGERFQHVVAVLLREVGEIADSELQRIGVEQEQERIALLRRSPLQLPPATSAVCITSLGDRRYRVGDAPPVRVTFCEDVVLQAFLNKSPLTKPELADVSGYDPETVVRTLRSLRGTRRRSAKYDALFAPFIRLPGRAHAGGYHVEIGKG
jgi:hypothetical protein